MALSQALPCLQLSADDKGFCMNADPEVRGRTGSLNTCSPGGAVMLPRVAGGVGYAHHRLTPSWALAALLPARWPPNRAPVTAGMVMFPWGPE